MTPDERDLLTRFLQDLTSARTGPKDPEADRMIAQALSANPDAAYLLVQHTILSDQALHAAQARIAELESQASAQPAPSFLGGGQPWGQQARPQTAVPPSAPPQDYAPQQPPPWAGAPGPFSSGGGLGSFLRSAGTTAAGVVGGEMLFEGLSGLFGGHRGLFGGGYGGGFGGGFGGGGFGGAPVENVTINNYDDDDRGDRDDRDDNSWNDDDNGGGFDDGNY